MTRLPIIGDSFHSLVVAAGHMKRDGRKKRLICKTGTHTMFILNITD